jgi:anti-sigma factor RsiW
MTGEHPGEELQDLLDGRLQEPRRSEVAAHVEGCARCRRELDALRWIKAEAAKHLADVEMPPALAGRVRAALDAADRRDRLRVRRRAWIGAAVAAAAVLILLARGHETSSVPALVAADFDAFATGTTSLGLESANPSEVERYFARNGIDFPTRVFDLGMMQYQLVGGRVHELDGRPSALFAYRGPGGTALICQMYQGRIAELAPTEDVREHNAIRFHVHRQGNLTLVFWQEGDVVCVLASSAPTETVVQLAFAKAVRVEL